MRRPLEIPPNIKNLPNMSSKLTKWPTSINIKAIRHSIKDNFSTDGKDTGIPLTSDGVELASQRGHIFREELSNRPDFTRKAVDQTSIVASPKIRTQQTAKAVVKGMGSTRERGARISNNLSFLTKEESKDDKGLESILAKEGEDALRNKEYVWYLVENSDQRALETLDISGENFTQKAGNVARQILHYVKKFNLFDKIITTNKDGKRSPIIPRIMVSHAGNIESFFLKALKNMGDYRKGDYESFLYKNKNGFDFVEGIDIEVKKDNNGEIVIKLTNKDPYILIDLKKEDLEEMISQSNQLNREIRIRREKKK